MAGEDPRPAIDQRASQVSGTVEWHIEDMVVLRYCRPDEMFAVVDLGKNSI